MAQNIIGGPDIVFFVSALCFSFSLSPLAAADGGQSHRVLLVIL